MRLIISYISLLFFFSVDVCSAQEVTARFSGKNPKQHQMKIGEQVILELGFHHHDTTNVDWPRFKDTLPGNIEVVDRSNIQTAKNKGIYTLSQTLTITAWDSGHFAVPPIPFLYGSDTLLTEPLLLSVSTVPVDTTKEAKDIKGIYGDNYNPESLSDIWSDVKDKWPWILAGILIAMAIIGGIIYYRQKNKEPQLAPKPSLPPHILARRELNKLEEERLWQNGKVKEFHVRLTNILRLYIEQRYRVRAMEQTTDEILRGIKYTDIDEETKQLLARVMKLSDMVKFAKEKPIATENEQSLEYAREFITSTEPVENNKEEEAA